MSKQHIYIALLVAAIVVVLIIIFVSKSRKYEGKAIRIVNTAPVHLVYKGKRYWIADPASFTNIMGFSLDAPNAVTNISAEEFNKIPYSGVVIHSRADLP